MKRLQRVSVAFLALSLMSLLGCMGSKKESPFDGLLEGAFVEAFIEYPGPSEKWVGPETLLIHVDARSNDGLKFKISPSALYRSGSNETIELENRIPAEQKARGLNSSTLRERLAELSEKLDETEETFSGCLHPVRVRLTKVDGGVREWQGCRGANAWSKEVGQLSSDLLATARVL